MRSSILALASLAAVAFSKDHIKHHLKTHHHHEVSAAPSWPPVIAPFNFEYEVMTYRYDPVTHEMTRDFELGQLQYTDSDHNQQVISVLRTINGERREIF